MRNPGILSAVLPESLRDARVLVTGASGFIGRHLIAQANAAGHGLHTLGRGQGAAGTTHHVADLLDREATVAAIRTAAPDVVINLAAPGVAFGTADFLEMAKVAALGSEALLAACAELPRPPHFVHIGSGFEYAPQDRPVRESDPVIPSATRYGAAKAAASAVVGGFAGMLPITIVRPFNVFGAGDTAPRLGSHIVAQAMAGNRIETTLGGQLRDFLHVDDFGRLLWDIAAAPASQSDFAIYNAGSTEPRLLRAYIEAIAEALTDAGYPAEIAYGAVAYRPGEPMIAIPDTERLTAGFAWQPRIDFASGVKDFVNWTIARCA